MVILREQPFESCKISTSGRKRSIRTKSLGESQSYTTQIVKKSMAMTVGQNSDNGLQRNTPHAPKVAADLYTFRPSTCALSRYDKCTDGT